MHLQVLSSGSQGNAVLVRAGEIHLLIDAGLPLDELERRLEAARMPLQRIDGIALSHGHLDHARAAGALAKKSGARVYCSERMMSNASVRQAPLLCTLPVGSSVTIRCARDRDELELASARLPHDADPTLGFKVTHQGRTAAVVTDLGTRDARAARALGGVHVLVLEFNHDRSLLASGPYPPALRRRVGGPRGHLSNEEAAAMLLLMAGPELHTLVLAHLSTKNNTPERALEAAQRALCGLGLGHVRVLVAAQDRIGENLAV